MHNGALTTLEEVVAFYVQCSAGKLPYAVPDLDFVLAQGPMQLSDAEQRQLVIFMKEGLTDLSQQPVPPSRVPSGLAVGGTLPPRR